MAIINLSFLTPNDQRKKIFSNFPKIISTSFHSISSTLTYKKLNLILDIMEGRKISKEMIFFFFTLVSLYVFYNLKI